MCSGKLTYFILLQDINISSVFLLWQRSTLCCHLNTINKWSDMIHVSMVWSLPFCSLTCNICDDFLTYTYWLSHLQEIKYFLLLKPLCVCVCRIAETFIFFYIEHLFTIGPQDRVNNRQHLKIENPLHNAICKLQRVYM